MAIVEISIVPLGTGSTSVSHYVAECLKVLDDSGLHYELHGMGTLVEGALEPLFAVIQKMHEVPFQKGAQRVVTTVKLDDRRDKPSSIQEKVASVIRKKG
jgi:uncharacterized protein (TIGR00106 family)